MVIPRSIRVRHPRSMPQRLLALTLRNGLFSRRRLVAAVVSKTHSRRRLVYGTVGRREEFRGRSMTDHRSRDDKSINRRSIIP